MRMRGIFDFDFFTFLRGGTYAYAHVPTGTSR